MRLATFASMLIISLFVTVPAMAEAKLGYVDMQKMIQTSDAGKDAKDQLAIKGAKYEAEKNVKEEELRKLKGDLEKQSVLLSEPARMAKEKDYQQKLKEYQRFMKDAQEDLQIKQEELVGKMYEEIVKIVQEYGKKNSFTFIFEKSPVMIYTDDNVDVTDELLKQFNASRKAGRK